MKTLLQTRIDKAVDKTMGITAKLDLLSKLYNPKKADNTDIADIIGDKRYRCYLYVKSRLVGTCNDYETAKRWQSWDTTKTLITIVNPDTPKLIRIGLYTAFVKDYDSLMLLKRLYGAKVRHMA